MSIAAYSDPVVYAEPNVRSAYLRKVGLFTFAGLTTAAVVGFVSAGMVAALQPPAFLSIIIMLGAFYGGAEFIGKRMVYSENPVTKYSGFFVGSGSVGLAMGFLLLSAMGVSAQAFGNPFWLIGEAFVLTGLIALGMMFYLLTGPKNLSYVGAALSMLTIPMFAIMGVMVIAPSWFGGPIGMAISVLFVVVSAGGLLYQLNQVIHKLPSTKYVEGAYHVTLGLLVLYWNLLVLLMRLNRR